MNRGIEILARRGDSGNVGRLKNPSPCRAGTSGQTDLHDAISWLRTECRRECLTDRFALGEIVARNEKDVVGPARVQADSIGDGLPRLGGDRQARE